MGTILQMAFANDFCMQIVSKLLSLEYVPNDSINNKSALP